MFVINISLSIWFIIFWKKKPSHNILKGIFLLLKIQKTIFLLFCQTKTFWFPDIHQSIKNWRRNLVSLYTEYPNQGGMLDDFEIFFSYYENFNLQLKIFVSQMKKSGVRRVTPNIHIPPVGVLRRDSWKQNRSWFF